MEDKELLDKLKFTAMFGTIMLDLEKEYSKQFQQIISAEKVLKLRQAEIDFRKLVLRHVQRRN